jgi:protein arginine kinase activator
VQLFSRSNHADAFWRDRDDATLWRPRDHAASVWRPGGDLTGVWRYRDARVWFRTRTSGRRWFVRSRASATAEHDDGFASDWRVSGPAVCRNAASAEACSDREGSGSTSSGVPARTGSSQEMGRRLHGIVVSCSRCQAPNPTIHMTVKMGIVYVEMHFCRSCAPGPEIEVSQIATNMICCPRCGTQAKDINTRGFGCADDYEIFASVIADGISKYHGASQHVGKIPSKNLFYA